MTDLPGRRLLLVHAHPDDESINNGATMAKYAAEGAHVTLVTCTLGEEGEVIPPDLAHLAPDRDDALGPHRIGELAAAMTELGVTDHRFLGGPGRYRDSGMMGLPQNDRPGGFWRADVDEAAAPPGRGDPRGAPAGARHLRPRRRLRPPRPHPGPPRRHARRRAGRRARASGRTSASRTSRPRLLEPVPRSVAEEGFARLRRRRGGGDFPFGPRRSRRRDRRRPGRGGRRRDHPPRSTARRTPQARRRRCAPTPPRSPWTATCLRALQRARPAALRHRVLPVLVRGEPGRRGAATRRDLFAGVTRVSVAGRTRSLASPTPAAVDARARCLPGLAVLGVLIGAAGALVQAALVPRRAAARAAGAAGLFHGGASCAAPQLGAAAPAAGWAVAVMLLTTSRPEGDFLFGAGSASYIYPARRAWLAAVMCATIRAARATAACGKRTN